MKKKRTAVRAFLFLYLAVNILFVLSCYGGHFSSWPLEFLVLAGFYLFLLMVALSVGWLFVRPWVAVLGAICTMLCWTPLKNTVRFFPSPDFEIAKTAGALRVMHWNADRFDVLANNPVSEKKLEEFDLIKLYRPDIFCCVETVASKTKKDAANYLPDMLAGMDMKDMHYVFDDAEYYYKDQFFGKIIVSRFPIINSKIVAYGDKSYNNRFIYADIATPFDTVRVFALHLQSLKFDLQQENITQDPGKAVHKTVSNSLGILEKIKRGFVRRAAQADTIFGYIRQSPYPTVVCGDFNDVPNSYAYTKIGAGMRNAFAEKGSGLDRSFSGMLPTLRIDNIFLSKGFGVLQFDTPKKELSDHYPVIADVTIGGKR